MIKKSKIYILNDLKFMKSNLLLILIFTFIQYIHGEEILCELRGTYETTYSIPSRNYLQDIGDALKNFTAGPYTPFLVDKAKANISDKWDKEEFFVNQYWNKDDISGELTLVDYEVDPAINRLLNESNKEIKRGERSISLEESFTPNTPHPSLDEYVVDYYKVINSLNFFTGKGRIEGNIFMSGKEIKNLKSPKVSFLARGQCGPAKKKY